MAIKDNLKGGSNLTFIARASSSKGTTNGITNLTVSANFPSTNINDYVVVIEDVKAEFSTKNVDFQGLMSIDAVIGSVNNNSMVILTTSHTTIDQDPSKFISLYGTFAIYYKG